MPKTKTKRESKVKNTLRRKPKSRRGRYIQTLEDAGVCFEVSKIVMDYVGCERRVRACPTCFALPWRTCHRYCWRRGSNILILEDERVRKMLEYHKAGLHDHKIRVCTVPTPFGKKLVPSWASWCHKAPYEDLTFGQILLRAIEHDEKSEDPLDTGYMQTVILTCKRAKLDFCRLDPMMFPNLRQTAGYVHRVLSCVRCGVPRWEQNCLNQFSQNIHFQECCVRHFESLSTEVTRRRRICIYKALLQKYPIPPHE